MQAQVHASTSKLPVLPLSVAGDHHHAQAGAPPPSPSPLTAHAISAKAAGKARALDDKSTSHRAKPPQTWKQIVKSGVAGGLAACLAKTSVAPLDRVKILFQTGSQPFEKYSGSWTGVFRAMNQIYSEGGTRALLQGHSMTLLRIYPYASIKFMAYEGLHRYLMPTPDKVTGPRLFAAGALAGVTSVFFTYPLELVRVRLAYDRALPASQLQGHSTLVYSILKIYHEGDPPPRSAYTVGTPLQPPVPSPSHTLGNLQANGQTLSSSAYSSPPKPYFKNPSKATVVASSLFARFPVLKFYRGFVVSIIGMIPYAGTSFLVWGFLKKKTPLKKGENKHSTTLNLTYGAVAGAAAQTASYPFEVVRRRMQVGGLLRPDRFFGFWETVSFIYQRKGLRGFYVGLSIGYLKVIPLTAISFASWEAIKKVLKV